jgi:hypothetical protein
MKEEELLPYLGTIFYGVLVETFLDQKFKKRKIRVRPLPDQAVPKTLHVSCSRRERELFSVGTQFKLDLRLCRKANGKFYLNYSQKKKFLPAKKETIFYSFGKQLLLFSSEA